MLNGRFEPKNLKIHKLRVSKLAMDNKNPEEKINPIVIMGKGMAFQLSDILDMDNKPEVKAAIDEWLAKKQKAFERAEKRNLRKPYKKRK